MVSGEVKSRDHLTLATCIHQCFDWRLLLIKLVHLVAQFDRVRQDLLHLAGGVIRVGTCCLFVTGAQSVLGTVLDHVGDAGHALDTHNLDGSPALVVHWRLLFIRASNHPQRGLG
jgi:hypothetical protein